MCLCVFPVVRVENLPIPDTPRGAGTTELSTQDMKMVLHRQWELLPHLSSTVKAHSGE